MSDVERKIEIYDTLVNRYLKPGSDFWKFASEHADAREIKQVRELRQRMLRNFFQDLAKNNLLKLKASSRKTKQYLAAPAIVRRIENEELFKMAYVAWKKPFSNLLKAPSLFMQDFGDLLFETSKNV